MSDPRNNQVAETAEEAQFTELAERVALALRLGRLQEAARVVQEMLARWPERTTTQELAGDVAHAQGKVARARQHYKRALEIEPANADAERKYALTVLQQTPEERQTALVHNLLTNPAAATPSPRRPLNAVLHALAFPGLGQLYNREHEKGLGILGAAVIALTGFLSIVLPYISASLTLGNPNARLAQQRAAQAVIENTGAGQWLLVGLCALIYVGLYAWGIYDAWKQARAELEATLSGI